MIREVYPTVYDLSAGRAEPRRDLVAEETSLHIFLNQAHYATILCSPDRLEELAVGHLLSEGVIESAEDIREVRLEADGRCRVRLKAGIDAERRIATSRPFSRLIISACGSPDYFPLTRLIDRPRLTRVTSEQVVDAGVVAGSVRRLNTLGETFRRTGGVHVAALYSVGGGLKTWAEDVGRHNAVDKVIGAGALEGADFQSCFLALSGRLTGDIVLKAARVGIPVVSSMAAAVSSGVQIALDAGVTLVGFVRGRRMSVYTHPERIFYKP